MDRPNAPTLCALAAVAFVVACVAHEAVGHGGACLAMGGTIRVLSSSLFSCVPSPVVIDGAGPLASLATAVSAAGLARVSTNQIRRTFFALLLAFAGFWIAGELVASAVTDTDDMAFVLRALPLHPYWLWRVVMGSVGIALYLAVLRRAGRDLPGGPPLVAAYLTAGVVSCVGAAFYQAPSLAAFREAALESFGASAGLLVLARRPPLRSAANGTRGVVPYSRAAIALSVPTVILFWLALGRGVVRR